MDKAQKALLTRLSAIDPDLAESFEDELERLNWELTLKPYRERVERAENNLDEACGWAMEDMTGQDGEEYSNACARDLIDARDDLLRHEDPDRYSEMKAMGQLR